RVKRLLTDSDQRPPATLLPTDVGPMLYPADDTVVTPWVAAHGSWEPEESQFLRSLLRPGMGFIDIGAHVGYVSLLAAECIGPRGTGIALEPAPGNFAFLNANLLLAGASRILPVPAAAWRTSGEVQLGLSPDNSGDHRVSDHRSGATVSVPAVALDDLLPPDLSVGVIKVDAQGRDHVALEGAVGTISKSRPVVLVEYWPEGITELGDEPEQVLDFYRSLGFNLRMLGDDIDCSKNSCVVEAALAKPGGYGTLILTPKDGNRDL
ncbi:MAG: FkbM family methyltransferase, partial [Actinobacteria bacterium]|nr:FkbM family methyltransferase [Actinomycetota bacterium]